MIKLLFLRRKSLSSFVCTMRQLHHQFDALKQSRPVEIPKKASVERMKPQWQWLGKGGQVVAS